jgi:hypothetical protein
VNPLVTLTGDPSDGRVCYVESSVEADIQSKVNAQLADNYVIVPIFRNTNMRLYFIIDEDAQPVCA